MATRRTSKRFNWLAAGFLVCLLIFCVATPVILFISSNQISVRSSDLIAASRDSVRISEPTALGQSQLVVIEQGNLFPADASGHALEVPLTAAQLTRGDGRFALDNAVLRLQPGQSILKGESLPPILAAVSKLQFDTLMLRQSTLHITLPDGRTEVMVKIDGELTNRRRALAIVGRGELRGQRVDFDISVGHQAEPRQNTTVPLKMSVKSGPLDVSFEGQVGGVGAYHLKGDVEFSSANVRRIARWFGAPWPNGNGLRNLSGRGEMEWSGPALAVNQATFLMDGNEATGSIHFKFAEQRPSIGGTLALGVLDLGRYFPSSTTAIEKVTGTLGWASVLGIDLTMPLTEHFDADLRVSANKVKLGSFQLGRSAAAVTVAQGRMLADVAAFEFEGSRGSGQITADMLGAIPRISLRGRLDDVDAARTLSSMFGHPVLAGKATITTDVTAQGKTGETLLLTSKGRINVSMRNGGRIGADLRGLAGAAQKRAIEGWGSAGRGQSPFDTFEGTFVLRSGALIAESAISKSAEVETVVAGTIDLAAGRLNGSVMQNLHVPFGAPTLAAATHRPPLFMLQIFGPWAKPTVRNDSAREQATDPIVGLSPAGRL